MKSEMPSFNQTKDLYTMKMLQYSVGTWNECPSIGHFPTHIENLETGEMIHMRVHKFTGEDVRGNVPRKVWWDNEQEEWKVMFYSTQAVEIEDRQLKDKFCCFMSCCATDLPKIGYHIEMTMLIDQIKGPNDEMYYVFMFSETSLSDIVEMPTK